MASVLFPSGPQLFGGVRVASQWPRVVWVASVLFASDPLLPGWFLCCSQWYSSGVQGKSKWSGWWHTDNKVSPCRPLFFPCCVLLRMYLFIPGMNNEYTWYELILSQYKFVHSQYEKLNLFSSKFRSQYKKRFCPNVMPPCLRRRWNAKYSRNLCQVSVKLVLNSLLSNIIHTHTERIKYNSRTN